ncbi:uncharacterized protein LOC141605796 isoform X2 [Silene latifolia]|uniref:uncharacterized protein LOC141605796 isoform X2 n=1 Tax=Silene latifolia TaxID=37657 RepID=UPI003D7741AC
MAQESFMEAVEEGLKLSKRLYYGKDRSIAPPRPPPPMSKSPNTYLPTAAMLYAVVTDPAVVDNPDIPSYQPYVYGRCDPPALIPLHMNRVSLEVDSYLDDTVFVTVAGEWRVHCVMGSKTVDCRLAVPMGEQGSIHSVEIDIPRKSYHTQLVATEDKRDLENALGADDGLLLRPDIFLLTIPQVDGGTNVSIKISWSQKLLYHDGEFSLCIPFSFPEYVTPPSKKIPKSERIQLNVHPGSESEVVCKIVSHPLKERKRQVDSLSFLYESDVLSWSSMDFSFSYSVPCSHISGSVLLQSPSVDDIDQRDIFCMHILPGSHRNKKVFPRKIIYVIDTSRSMQGKPLETTKRTLCDALSELNPQDSFNIIGFNGDICPFSLSTKIASRETIEEAVQWIGTNFVTGDGTNISLALKKALEMLSDTRDALPMVIMITDGAVEDERRICNDVKSHLSNMKSISPRIHTFGIGLYCNHYFLRMLAMIGRGLYDAAYETDGIENRFQRLINRASSALFANMTFDALDELNDVEIYPTSVPDLSSEGPLIISGRYKGDFPEVVKVSGIVADMTSYEVDLKVTKAKGIPLERILALQQIIIYTSQAWFLESKQLESKVENMSIRNSIVSEFTSMALFVTETLKKEADSEAKKKKSPSKGEAAGTEPKPKKVKVLKKIGIGFGNVKATTENISPGFNEPKPPEAAEIIVKAASDCCTRMCGYCCCMCCIQICSKMSNQCAIVLTQACTALACFGCLECCSAICCSGND